MNNQTQTTNETTAIQNIMVSDLKSSILVVSLFANLVIFTVWVAVQVTSRYDAALASFLINR